MKPPPFEYQAPASLEEALDLMARHGGAAKALAGGQSLVPVLNFRLARPAVLVDLNSLSELDFLHVTEDGELRIGGLTRQRRLEDPAVRDAQPLLHETAPWIAHPQIRNRGTVGGSLAHADPAAELPAVALALGARMRLASSTAERWVAAGDFYTGLFDTALDANELLLETAWPAPPPRTGTAFLEQARRQGDYAQAGVAVVLTLGEDGTITAARLAYLSAGDGPVSALEAAEALVGETPSADLFAAVAQSIGDEIEPTGDVHAPAAYKLHLAKVLTRRALHRAAERAGHVGDAG
jgi:aerobic carbon-monoxide dehydrogenase medium subunit